MVGGKVGKLTASTKGIDVRVSPEIGLSSSTVGVDAETSVHSTYTINIQIISE